jgi:hypothetical protein
MPWRLPVVYINDALSKISQGILEARSQRDAAPVLLSVHKARLPAKLCLARRHANCGHSLERASHRDLVPRGHDQCRLAPLVHTAEPTCVRKQLTLLPVTDAGGLAYLHRRTAARAGVAIAGNYNRFSSSSSFHSRPPSTLMNPPGGA